MRQHLAVRAQHLGFGRYDLAAPRDHASLDADAAGILGDRAGEIALGLDGGVSGSGRQQGMGRAAASAVDRG